MYPVGVFHRPRLFRSSRPDYIETMRSERSLSQNHNCSGLPDRTTLRLGVARHQIDLPRPLFRSSRPDYIETHPRLAAKTSFSHDCSGLPDRTTLRHPCLDWKLSSASHCSGLPDRTTLRPPTLSSVSARHTFIVPVFQTGLH